MLCTSLWKLLVGLPLRFQKLGELAEAFILLLPPDDLVDPPVLCLLCLPDLRSGLSRPLGSDVDFAIFSTGSAYFGRGWRLLLPPEMLASQAFSFSSRFSLEGGGSRGGRGS